MNLSRYVIAIPIIIFFSAIFFMLSGEEVNQPIRFNHNKHVEGEGMECSDCHHYYKTHANAGLPSAEDCATCHSEAIGESPEEEKLIGLIGEERDLHWKRIFQIPKHVFFSHRRHTVLGLLECDVCHGNMKGRTSPPQKKDNNLAMEFCMECHTNENVSNDCLNCHR